MSSQVAPALRALVEGLIDYAGVFPPASLTVESAVLNYKGYAVSEYSWMLRWFVVNSSEQARIDSSIDGRLSLLGEIDSPRAASLETKSIVQASHPVYCEVGLDNLDALDAVKAAKCFAKIRTGGVKPEAIPTVEQVAAFISGCAERRLAFKATAGLHHPIRAVYPLTYETNPPYAMMHGFLNVLMAAAFAWHGDMEILAVLGETDATAFRFNDRAHWRDKSLSVPQISEVRLQFLHSIGSCSFEEPVNELKSLGLLPSVVELA